MNEEEEEDKKNTNE